MLTINQGGRWLNHQPGSLGHPVASMRNIDDVFTCIIYIYYYKYNIIYIIYIKIVVPKIVDRSFVPVVDN